MNEKEGFIQETPYVGNELEKRKEKVISFLKRKKDWAYYLILAFIVWVGFYIRTRNIPRLKDVTTGTWTLGPDLDPFLFLRWAEYIVEHGSLMVHDVMRYVPLGYNTAGEIKLLSYLIAWFYHFLSFFSKQVTVTYAAIWFPVFMFALTTIAFFLFAREIFYKESKRIRNIIALIATSFFVLIPSLLPRTIAGIPEKESAGFFFLFIAFYFFLKAFTSGKFKKRLIYGLLAGVATGLMALIWGGFIFVFLTIPTAVLLGFIFGKVKKQEFFIYSIWLFSSFCLMMFFSTRYVFSNLISSTSTGLGIGVFILIGMSLIINKITKLKELRIKTKLPSPIFSLILSGLILFILILIVLGPSFFLNQFSNIKSSLIQPMITRFGLTVAENKQPFFADDWKNSFGPIYFNIPLFFWMFIAGSVMLFNNLIKKLRRGERIILTLSYLLFLICLIFSRSSPESVLNGTNGISILVYFGGALLFLFLFGKIYFKRFKEGDFYLFKDFNFAYILYFIILTLGIIGARGGIRLIMLLGAVSPVAIAFLIVRISQKYVTEKEESIKFFIGICALIIILAGLFTIWTYYQQDRYTAENFAPGAYQGQWQRAMQWVRENTAVDSVFAHWWDYGYWVQSIGKRATILDGGNGIVYWNHLMGRHVLTGTDESTALEFLYTHNGTHLLIDSTEIGKYTAYSSIGSDKDYDRFSWIPTIIMNPSQTQETNNETIYIYPSGSSIDEDIIWEQDGKEIFLPKKKAGIGAIIIKKDKNGKLMQPEAVFMYNNIQYRIPLRYLSSSNSLQDFGSGLEAGIFLFPKINEGGAEGMEINEIGAGFYLSERTIHSQLATLYLFGKESNYFKLVHTEPSYVISQIREGGFDIGDFVYYQGFQGPIKIWEINYPSNINSNPEYLEGSFPDEEINLAKYGEY